LARPPKWRRVEFIPNIHYFVPLNIKNKNVEENILLVEEIEAMRLKDLEKLEQEECAEKMQVSRQTFQRVLNNAREKITDSIIKGKAIRIEGGNFTRNICPIRCLDCGREWKESYENFEKIVKGEYSCYYCQSNRIICLHNKSQKFCRRNCWRINSIEQ